MANPTPVRRQIQFYQTMTEDSHQPGAVLRRKCLDINGRLIQRGDFRTTGSLSGNFIPEIILGGGDYAIGESDNAQTSVFERSRSTGRYSFVAGNRGSSPTTGPMPLAAAFYNNGNKNDDGDDEDNKLIYILVDDQTVESFNTSNNDYRKVSAIDIPRHSDRAGHFVLVDPTRDRLLFVTGNNVYRLNGTTWEGKVFSLPPNDDIENVFMYNESVIFIRRTPSGQLLVSAWNGDASIVNRAFSWTFSIGRGGHVVSGVASGLITVVSIAGESSNDTESTGYLRTHVYNGGGFREINKIETKGGTASISGTHADGDNLYAGFFDPVDIIHTGIYQFAPNGRITVHSDIPDISAYWSISSDEDGLLVGYRENDGDYRIGRASGSHFEHYSEFITGFLEDGFFQKKMYEINFDYEKLENRNEDTPEEGLFYFRTSKNEEWTLIGTVKYEEDFSNNPERKIFKKTTEGEDLHFKKVQFRVLFKGNLKLGGGGYGFLPTDDI